MYYYNGTGGRVLYRLSNVIVVTLYVYLPMFRLFEEFFLKLFFVRVNVNENGNGVRQYNVSST